jgi:hypothetical protein
MANWQKALDRSLNWVDEHTRSDNTDKGTKTAKGANKTGTAHDEKGEKSAKSGDGNDSAGKTANSTKSADKGATQHHDQSKVSGASSRLPCQVLVRDGMVSSTHCAQVPSRPRVISALHLLVYCNTKFCPHPDF